MSKNNTADISKKSEKKRFLLECFSYVVTIVVTIITGLISIVTFVLPLYYNPLSDLDNELEDDTIGIEVQNSDSHPIMPQDLSSNSERFSYAADLMDQSDYKTAQVFLSNFLLMEGLDEEIKMTIYYDRGICYYHTENYYQATSDFKEVAIRSSNPDAYYNLGCAYLNQESYQEAYEAFGQAVSIANATGSTISQTVKQTYYEAQKYAEDMISQNSIRDKGNV